MLTRYNRFVKPDFEKFVKPQMKLVDLIIPGGASNDIALNFVVENIRNRLASRRPVTAPEKCFRRLESSRKLSTNKVNQLCDDLPLPTPLPVPGAAQQNHVPLSRELRRTAEAFFPQLAANPDAELLRSNMKYLSRLAREDILGAMCSDFQMEAEELTPLVERVDLDKAPAETRDGGKRIFFVRLKSLLRRAEAERVLERVKRIDNFPVYVQVDFVGRAQVELICRNSPNTHLFSLFFLECGDAFLASLPPKSAQALL